MAHMQGQNMQWDYWHPNLGNTKLIINFIGSDWTNVVYYNPGLSTFESVDQFCFPQVGKTAAAAAGDNNTMMKVERLPVLWIVRQPVSACPSLQLMLFVMNCVSETGNADKQKS